MEEISSCCSHIVIDSTGEASLHQEEKFGEYRIEGVREDRPLYNQVYGSSLCVEDMPAVGMGEGPKRRLELVNCGVQSRPSTQNRARRLYLDLDLTETCTRQIHFW